MFSTADRQRQVTRKAVGMCPWLEALESRMVLSTFKVNTLLDTVAVNLKTGKDASGHVSLRSAGWLGSSWRQPASPQRASRGPGGVALRASTPATPEL